MYCKSFFKDTHRAKSCQEISQDKKTLQKNQDFVKILYLMILIYPPVAKPCEPPAGIAKLAGALTSNGIACQVLDASIEGILSLLEAPATPSDTWTRRASRNLSRNLKVLRSWDVYTNIDQYKRAVMDVNRVLEKSVIQSAVRISLANYFHQDLSPIKSNDLMYAAEHPEENPFYPYFSRRLPELIGHNSPSMVGFSLNYLSQAFTTFAMIGFLKREFPGLIIIVGGGLMTSWMRSPAWHSLFKGLIDHLVAGPGEYPLLSILGKKILDGENYPPTYNSLPLDDYLSPGFILPYSSSTGCYWNKCSFCPERAEGNPYAQIPPYKAVKELRNLTVQMKPVLIHMVDNAISPHLLEAIIDTPPQAPWYGFARITSHLTDLDFCMALKSSGCVMLKLGVESGDQGVLDDMHKGNDIEMTSFALKTLKKSGIATYVYLLFGTPSETATEARATLDFTVRHSDYIDFLNIAIFNLPLNSPETSKLETMNFYEGDLSLYTDFIHPEGWNRQRVRQFLEKEFKKHPAIQSILRKHPPIFTSNHAPLFVMKHASASSLP